MRAILVLLLAVFSFPISAQPSDPADTVRVSIHRSGEQWSATFEFPRDEAGWAFLRSNRARDIDASWRLASWDVATPGVELVRIGELDVLRTTAESVPRRVKINFEPYGHDIQADYDPAMIFGDGTVALFTGHFATRPWGEEEIHDGSAKTQSLFALHNEGGSLTYKGKSYQSVDTTDAGTYVIFGSPEFISTKYFTGLLDPGIPAWMRDELDNFLPLAFEGLTERLGEPAIAGKPMILGTWAGPTPGRISRGGSVMPGIVTLRFEGEGMLERRPDEIQPVRWFLSHEAAHFWAGQTVNHIGRSQAWISEGGASLLAYRLIQSIDPAYDPGADLANDWQECLELSANGPLVEVHERRDYRANYACGAVLGMIAEGAAQTNGNRDFFDFWRSLIDANRADVGGDGFASVSDWIAQVSEESGDHSLAADLFQFINHGADDPQIALCSMLAKVERSAPGCIS